MWSRFRWFRGDEIYVRLWFLLRLLCEILCGLWWRVRPNRKWCSWCCYVPLIGISYQINQYSNKLAEFDANIEVEYINDWKALKLIYIFNSSWRWINSSRNQEGSSPSSEQERTHPLTQQLITHQSLSPFSPQHRKQNRTAPRPTISTHPTQQRNHCPHRISHRPLQRPSRCLRRCRLSWRKRRDQRSHAFP